MPIIPAVELQRNGSFDDINCRTLASRAEKEDYEGIHVYKPDKDFGHVCPRKHLMYRAGQT